MSNFLSRNNKNKIGEKTVQKININIYQKWGDDDHFRILFLMLKSITA